MTDVDPRPPPARAGSATRSAAVGPPRATRRARSETPARDAGAARDAGSTQWFESNPLWFKAATFYEIHVRGFYDANADGSGDFRGLTDKLDYLEWLGIDCIWLLPMYASPLRDGGYDTSDFRAVHPDYGTIEDVRTFIDSAHQRGIRVIADLVMNHTSNEHSWFVESRSSVDSTKRNWYVWSDTADRYRGARVIFVDSEASNWTWDEQAGAYYWHRFFHHQPDLNYDEPEVQEAMLDTLRFWLDLGLDGFRLDAVPYLVEREGSNCENLPETHAFLRRVRATVDAEYPDRVLLAEANQWPEDVVQYFGDGDECHMAFHFPVMPRMFMALRRESAAPIVEILDRTPAIPGNCQWGLFLRNHDELTLEMVTDEERDYMYDEYARDPRMKLNVGIRRRLAPLLDNDRASIELLTAILFSLPGSPVLYYGDEIAMGDNVYLGDRDGVRTPMQWTGDRNGGFSRADFAQLYSAPLMDPVYGYQAVNIEAQLRTPASLLRWLRRFIGLRKEHPVFGLGSYEALTPSNPRIFAHVRRYEDDIALCVHNLARTAQAVELDLSEFAGRHPVEMLGRTRFPRIGELPYLLTFQPRGFLWFLLEAPDPVEEAPDGLAELDAAIIAHPVATVGELALEDWVVAQRWFGSKSRDFAQFNVREAMVLDAGPPLLGVILLEARLHAGTHELYQLPFVTRAVGDAPAAAVIATRDGAMICDALLDAREPARLLAMLAQGALLEDETSTVRFCWDGDEQPSANPQVRVLDVEQSNSSIVFDERFALKVFRRLEAGTNPELEMLRFLDAHGFSHIAPVEGWYSYQGELLDATLGVTQRFIRHSGDGWSLALEALASGRSEGFLAGLHNLGAITGRMHTALASDGEDAAFAPEEPSEEHVALISATLDEQIERCFLELPDLEALAPILGRSEELRDRLAPLSHHGAGGRLIRTHGDYHLGQAVYGVDGWTVLDFEGEPGRPIRERRRKRSPLRDVAGMLRSLAYAALASQLLASGPPPAADWEARARAQFLEGYLQEVDRRLLPAGDQAIGKLLKLFELEKVLYELRYELDNRPDWLVVPVAAIVGLLEEPLG